MKTMSEPDPQAIRTSIRLKMGNPEGKLFTEPNEKEERMSKYTPKATLETYEIKLRETGKKAKITLLMRLDINQELTALGTDYKDFLPGVTHIKKLVYSDILLLTEGFAVTLTALKSLKETDPPWSPDHRFSYVKFDKAEVNMEPLNGEHADPVAVLKAVFTVNVDESLNRWLFLHLGERVGLELTQRAEQQKLDLGREKVTVELKPRATITSSTQFKTALDEKLPMAA